MVQNAKVTRGGPADAEGWDLSRDLSTSSTKLYRTFDPAACRVHSAGYQGSLRVSVQRVFAALASPALALANWLRARRVRVCQIAGTSRGRRAHRRRRRREKALQARLAQRHNRRKWNVLLRLYRNCEQCLIISSQPWLLQFVRSGCVWICRNDGKWYYAECMVTFICSDYNVQLPK